MLLKAVKVCDRCGIHIMPGDCAGHEYSFMVKRVTRNKNGVVYKNEPVDLCPSCQDALEKFLYGNREGV